MSMSDDWNKRNSFQEFYGWVSPTLRGYIFRVCGDAALADDIFQESFLKYLRTVRWDMKEQQQKAFIFKIASRLIIDNFRRIKPQALDLVEKSGENKSASLTHGEHLEPDMKKIFTTLKPRDRSLLWLAYVEEYSHEEISEMMGLKVKSIKVLLFRLRGAFAQMLRSKGYGREEQS